RDTLDSNLPSRLQDVKLYAHLPAHECHSIASKCKLKEINGQSNLGSSIFSQVSPNARRKAHESPKVARGLVLQCYARESVYRPRLFKTQQQELNNQNEAGRLTGGNFQARAKVTKKDKGYKALFNSQVKQCTEFYDKYLNLEFGKELLVNPEYTWIIAIFCFVCEIFINSAIIVKRPYTEIDWKAYMQEVEGFLNGTLDYQYLKGDTGPLVYPAGFVYVFSVFYYVTERGTNLLTAQWIFGGLYLTLIYQVFRIYSRSRKVPPYALLFLTFSSYRIHSIFVLRLFNDPIAIILAYVAINAFLDGRWTLGSLAFSFAVSIKMNVLLYAPALLIVFLTQLSLFDAVIQLAVCGSLQVVLALPFLLVNPWSYISRSFDLGRVFLFEWTVNWKFLPEEYFLNRYFHIALLASHLIMLGVFTPAWIKYLKSYSQLDKVSKSKDGRKQMEIRSQLILYPLFVSNFIGIAFSRSLHYQFYVWYYHTIPYLLWSTRMPVRAKLATFGVIELCWNIFPATAASSLSLQLCHMIILVGLWHYAKPMKDWKVELKNK
ncbi:unnamed protein product, partial [Allacma fusca]